MRLTAGAEQVTAGSGSKYASKVNTTALGVITVTATGFGDTAIDSKKVTLAPLIQGTLVAATDGTKAVTSWRCGSSTDGTDMPAKYLPGSCKG